MPLLPRLKPTFEVPVEGDGLAVLVRLQELLNRPDCEVTGSVLKRHAFVQIPRERRSMLSPYLNLHLATQDETTVLVGRFSPHPHVWTGFMAIYGFLGFIGCSGLIYGCAQLTVDQTPWSMLAAPGSLLAIAFVWGAAVIGQGLTADQMYLLRRAVDRAVHDCGGPPRK